VKSADIPFEEDIKLVPWLNAGPSAVDGDFPSDLVIMWVKQETINNHWLVVSKIVYVPFHIWDVGMWVCA